MRRRSDRPKWIGTIAIAVVAIGVLAFTAPHIFSLVRPPITWVKPYMFHIGEVDLSDIPVVIPPQAGGVLIYAQQCLMCPNVNNRDIYFASAKPPGIEQWEYLSKEDTWAWFIDPVSKDGCSPNVGIAFRILSQTNPDPVTGMMSVIYDYEVILSCDPWLGGAIASPECGAKYKNSYFVLIIDSPYYVHRVRIDGKEATYYYDTSGKVKLIIPVEQQIPSTSPLLAAIPTWLRLLMPGSSLWWVERGVQFKHRLEIDVQTGVVQEYAETTIKPTYTWTVGPTGIVTIYGTRTVTYTAPVTITTRTTITEYRVVTVTATVVGGQTVTRYIPGGTTVYNTATFTISIVVTRETTATVTEPTTVTVFRTANATTTGLKDILAKILGEVAGPLAWAMTIILIILLAIIAVVVVMRVIAATTQGVRTARRSVGRRRRR